MAPASRGRPGLFKQAALGLWLLGVGLLGLLRATTKIAGDAVWMDDPVTWAWLAGSAAVLAWGAIATARALRRPGR